MPVVSVTLDSVQKNILTPIYFKIVQDLMKTLKLPETALVVMHNNAELALTDNRTNVSNQDVNNLPSTVSKRRLIANITEDYNEDELTSTSVNQYNAYPIFRDNDITVNIYPIYVKSDITIEVTYTSPSKTEAIRIRDDARLRLSQTRNAIVHDAEYTILIPKVVEDFIADIHELKSRLDPMSLEDYFRIHSTKRVYPITDMSNKENTRLGIHEKQIRFVGTFEFSPTPEKIEYDNDSNNYKFNFSYKLSMDIPRAMALRYPVMMCNRLLPNKYIDFLQDSIDNSQEEMYQAHNYTSFGNYNLSIFEAHRELENRVNIKLPVNVPAFDEFKVRQSTKGYAILASFLTDVNETDYRSLFNLRDIDPYDINETLLQYIRDVEYKHMTEPYESFMYLGLHQEGRFFDSNTLRITPDLDIYSTKNLTLYRPVRVTLSFSIDIPLLRPPVIQRLYKHPEVLLLVLNEYLEASNNFKTEGSKLSLGEVFNRIVIDMITHFQNTGENEVICGILQILTKYSYTESAIGRLLITSYPGLYDELLRQETVYINPNTYNYLMLCDLRKRLPEQEYKYLMTTKVNGRPDLSRLPTNLYRDHSNDGVMKTVMSERVIVYKK